MKTPIYLTDPTLFQEWKDHPTTVEFFQWLADRRLRLMERWVGGWATSPEEQAQAVVLDRLLRTDSAEIAQDYAGDENAPQEIER